MNIDRTFFEDQVYDWGRFKKNWTAHPYQNYPQVTTPSKARSMLQYITVITNLLIMRIFF